MVTDILGFTPYRLPGLVERGILFALQGESVHQVSLLQAFRCMLVFSQFQTKVGGLHNLASLIGHLIDGTSAIVDGKL